jgi:hypothetical protein
MMSQVKGPHPWALILCNANDQSVPAWPGKDYFQALIASPTANGLCTWWQQMAGGNLACTTGAVAKIIGSHLTRAPALAKAIGAGA